MVTEQTEATEVLDPVDLLVPRPRSLRQVAVVGTIVVGMLVGIGLAVSIGVVTPKIAVDGLRGDHWTAAVARRGPSAAYFVTNRSPYGVTIRQIDPTVVGLSNATATVARAGPDGWFGAPSVGLPVAIAPGATIEIALAFRGFRCDAITSRDPGAIQITVTDLFGLSRTVALTPLRFATVDGMSRLPNSATDPRTVGWPAALTWTACGHPGEIPTPIG